MDSWDNGPDQLPRPTSQLLTSVRWRCINNCNLNSSGALMHASRLLTSSYIKYKSKSKSKIQVLRGSSSNVSWKHAPCVSGLGFTQPGQLLIDISNLAKKVCSLSGFTTIKDLWLTRIWQPKKTSGKLGTALCRYHWQSMTHSQR